MNKTLNPWLARAKPYPVKLIVDIHSRCNARCTMCPYPDYARTQTQGVMEWPLYQKIIREMGELGRRHHVRPQLTYCYMAEPFLSPRLHEHVAAALEENLNVYLNTNAAAMTSEKVDALLATGFEGIIHVSFHGASPETYQRITGLDYHTTLGHLHYLLENYPARKVLVRGVDDGWPAGEKEQWLAMFEPLGVQLEYLPPISRCGAVERLNRPKSDNDKVRLYGCREHHPLVEMVILFDGRAVMCCQDMGREIIWGDVGRDGIEGVWNGPVRRQMVRKLYSGKPANMSFLCSRCEQAMGPGDMVGDLIKRSWNKLARAVHV